jgi:Protein of unknown function (DUF1194)
MRSCLPFVFAFCVASSPAIADCPDLSLVLAIDSSGSIDPGEYALQTLGYAAAFRSHGVKRALASAGVVDVAVVYWADADFTFQTLPWVRITSPQGADAVAAMLLAAPRLVSGDTDIGNGLALAIDMLTHHSRCSARSIVNVSGDGQESGSPKRKPRSPLALVRDRADELGVIVNALAIENEDPGLAQYYHDNLIAGPGAFVMQVRDFTDFGAAIEQKLVREISLTMTSSLAPPTRPY